LLNIHIPALVHPKAMLSARQRESRLLQGRRTARMRERRTARMRERRTATPPGPVVFTSVVMKPTRKWRR
jgi:hypothetical protein